MAISEDKVRKQRVRYLGMRAKILASEIAELKQEARELREGRGQPASKSDLIVRNRRSIYLKYRLEEARTEYTTCVEERRRLAAEVRARARQ